MADLKIFTEYAQKTSTCSQKEQVRLIDASDKRNLLYVSQEVFDCMQRIPPIDPESLRVQGEWIDLYGGKYANHRYACTRCGADALYKFEVDALGQEKAVQALSDSCPNCGAYMKGAGENA